MHFEIKMCNKMISILLVSYLMRFCTSELIRPFSELWWKCGIDIFTYTILCQATSIFSYKYNKADFIRPHIPTRPHFCTLSVCILIPSVWMKIRVFTFFGKFLHSSELDSISISTQALLPPPHFDHHHHQTDSHRVYRIQWRIMRFSMSFNRFQIEHWTCSFIFFPFTT